MGGTQVREKMRQDSMRTGLGSRSAEETFLLSCCSPLPGVESFESSMDWQWILRWACMHALLPAVQKRITRNSFPAPEPVAYFLEAYAAAVERYEASVWEQTIRVQSEWSRAGMETLVWPDPAAGAEKRQPRKARFPEFFVRPRDLADALEILKAAGYCPRQPAALSKNLSTTHTQMLLQGPEGGGLLLRWAVPGRRPKARVLEAIWEQSEAGMQNKVRCRFPSRVDTLLLHAMLGAEGQWNVLSRLHDFAHSTQAMGDVCAEEVLARASELNCRRRLLLAAFLVESTGVASLPAAICHHARKEISEAASKTIRSQWFSLPIPVNKPWHGLAWDLRWLDSRAQRARHLWKFVFSPTEADPLSGIPGSLLRPARLVLSALGLKSKESSISSYVPTPAEVVDQMLDLAAVGAEDTVYDLGCGDGRIVIRAAERCGARGVGVDLSAVRLREAAANSARLGVSHRLRFEQADLREVILREATVVILALPPSALMEAGATLPLRVRPGTRIVSYGGDTGMWEIAQVSAGPAYPQPIFLRTMESNCGSCSGSRR